MRALFLFLIVVFLWAFAKPVEALVVLPALLLIPIAKILALVIGLLAVPLAGLGVVWRKFYKERWGRIWLVIAGLLVLCGVMVAIFLKVQNPLRPWW